MDAFTFRDIERVTGPLEFCPAELKAKYDSERDKRILSDSSGQYVPVVDGKFARFSEDPWAENSGSREPIIDHTEVMIAGGGFGGLLLGARLREAGFSDIRIIDEAGDFGGTWYWNRYPGAMCDIEAHIYLPLLEELSYAPKHRYSYASEMLEHSRNIGNRYGLYEKACFQTVITSVRWLDDERKWLIETDRHDRMTATYFVLACGRQSLPKLPALPGINEFAGHTFHSSRWDYKYTGGSSTEPLTGLKDKRVAVIGTGATAIQIVPEVGKWAKELVVFQRTPSTVGLRGQRETAPDWVDMSQSGWQKLRRENFQHIISNSHQDIDYVGDGWTDIRTALRPMTKREVSGILGRDPTADELAYLAEVADYRVMSKIRSRVDEVVKDPATAEALKPWYRWACKRPCFHDDYLETFNRPNVKLVDTNGRGVERLTERGIVVAGTEYEVDCIIFATGFEAGINYTRLTGFEITGREAVTLSNHWARGVRTLHGMTTDYFPNCFFAGGNQQTAAAVNAVHLLDEQAIHISYMMAEARKKGACLIEPTSEAVDSYVDVINSSATNKILVEFFASCTPGYYNGEGKASRSEDLFIGGRYGDGPMPFYRMLETWRADGKLGGLNLA